MKLWLAESRALVSSKLYKRPLHNCYAIQRQYSYIEVSMITLWVGGWTHNNYVVT